MIITASLPLNRNVLGVLTVDSDPTFSDICLGRSDTEFATLNNNPTRDPLHTGGDTPYGTYRTIPRHFTSPVDEPTLHSFGPYGKIQLIPVSGDALTANRLGLLIHSGVLNPAYTQWQGLRPTHGCIRVPDPTMLSLLALADAALAAGAEVTCVVTELQSTEEKTTSETTSETTSV